MEGTCQKIALSVFSSSTLTAFEVTVGLETVVAANAPPYFNLLCTSFSAVLKTTNGDFPATDSLALGFLPGQSSIVPFTKNGAFYRDASGKLCFNGLMVLPGTTRVQGTAVYAGQFAAFSFPVMGL
jgi:hypothetical protein